MVAFDKSLVVQLLSEPDALIAQRQWDVLAEGVFVSDLYTVGEVGPRAALLRYLPGASVASHSHTGFEHILILHGTQVDGDVVYQTGDLVIHKPGTRHSIVSPNGCLALGIWEKPVAFVNAGE